MHLPLVRFLRLAGLACGLASASFFAGCHGTPYPVSTTWPMNGTVWKLVELNGNVVAERKLPSLTFDTTAGRVSGVAGINRFSGSYTQKGPALTFGPLAATKMAGPASAMQLEDDFLKALGRVTALEHDGQRLSLLAGDEEVARFQGMPVGSTP